MFSCNLLHSSWISNKDNTSKNSAYIKTAKAAVFTLLTVMPIPRGRSVFTLKFFFFILTNNKAGHIKHLGRRPKFGRRCTRWRLVASVTPRPRFTLGRGFPPPSTHWLESWLGLRAGLDRGKILCLCRLSNPGLPVCSRHYTDWTNTSGIIALSSIAENRIVT
jgi:hypothetical protein